MKRKKTPLVLCLCIFLGFAIAALIFFLNMPKDEMVESILDSPVTSVNYRQSGEGFYYSGGTKIVYVAQDGSQKEAIDLSEETGGERIYSLQTVEGQNALIAYSDNTRAYLLQEDGESFKILGSFSYSGTPLKVATDGNEIYVAYQIGNYCEVRVYDFDNISDDFLRRGLLYNYGGKGEGITLTLAKGIRVVNMFVEDDMLYVLHEGGLSRMDTSLTLNGVKYMSEEERAEIGVLSYNKNSYEVVISEEQFTTESLAIYTTGISGGCYCESNEMLYFISNDRTLMSYPVKEIGTQEIGTDLELKAISDVVLQDTKTAKSVLYYDRDSGIGYLIFDTTNNLVCVDFNTEQVLFTTEGQFDVNDLAISSDGSQVMLMYMNTNQGSEQNMYLKTYDVEDQANKSLFSTLSLVCLIIAVFMLAFTIFMAARTTNERYDSKVRTTLKKMWKHRWIYIILLPSLTGLFMFCYYPGLASLGLSFFDYTAEKQSMKWNNFANYINIFTNKYSLESFRNLVIFAFTDIITSLIPPLTFAFFLSFMRSKKFSNFTRTLLFIPGVIPSIAGTLIWKTGIYGEYGVLNTLIEAFNGEPIKFLTSSETALTSIILMGFPFVGSYLIFYGAIMNIADSYIEAAELEGCPLIKRLIKIDIPLIMPQIKYVLVMTLIGSAQNFYRVYMTTGGSWGTQVPINIMYNNLVAGDYGQSSAYAALLFLIMFIPMFINLRTQKKGME